MQIYAAQKVKGGRKYGKILGLALNFSTNGEKRYFIKAAVPFSL